MRVTRFNCIMTAIAACLPMAAAKNLLSEYIDEIGVYPVSGDGQAYSIHSAHKKNPAVVSRLQSIAVLDGNSEKVANEEDGVIKLPGGVPEDEVFNHVRGDIGNLSMRLAVALHLSPEKDSLVRQRVEDISRSNRDPHLLFNQIGQSLGFIPVNIVTSAFIGLWIDGNAAEAARVAQFIRQNVEAARTR